MQHRRELESNKAAEKSRKKEKDRAGEKAGRRQTGLWWMES